MLQGTSATARSVSVSSGQTRRALAISPSSVSCLPALSAFQRVAAVAPRTHVGGGCANHRPGKRAHRRVLATPQPAIVLGPTTVVGRCFCARPSAAVPAQHQCACLSLCTAGGCTSLRGAVTPNPSFQRTRQKRRAAELQYRWASLSAVTHSHPRSRVDCRSLVRGHSLPVQCCREHQQPLVASALVPVKRGRR